MVENDKSGFFNKVTVIVSGGDQRRRSGGTGAGSEALLWSLSCVPGKARLVIGAAVGEAFPEELR